MRTMEKTSDILRKRKEKIEEFKRDGINPFPNGFDVSDTIRDIQDSVEKSPQSLTEDEPIFVTAGRMMAINNFGKSAFFRITQSVKFFR